MARLARRILAGVRTLFSNPQQQQSAQDTKREEEEGREGDREILHLNSLRLQHHPNNAARGKRVNIHPSQSIYPSVSRTLLLRTHYAYVRMFIRAKNVVASAPPGGRGQIFNLRLLCFSLLLQNAISLLCCEYFLRFLRCLFLLLAPSLLNAQLP